MSTVVLDANVLISGYTSPSGAPAVLLDLWVDHRFQLAVSEVILAEIERTWTKPYWTSRLTPEAVQEIISYLRSGAEVTPISVNVFGVASHPEDDLVLATAVSANADYLVTGDKQLLAIGYYEGITILSPREFLTILETEG